MSATSSGFKLHAYRAAFIAAVASIAAIASAPQADAARSWADLTNFEYGSAWARWSLAGSKSVRYTKSDSGWDASVDARPCRG